MAGDDDDISKLLREVEGALGGGAAPTQPQGKSVAPSSPGSRRSLREQAPRAAVVGAGWGVGMGALFTLPFPFLHPISGAVAAFAAAFSVSLYGRWRRH